MGFDVSSIFAGGVEGIFKGVREVVGAFKADPTVVAQNAQKLAELEVAISKAQLEAEVQLSQAQTKIDEIEAASSDKFVSRWRPFVGWICGVGLGVALLVGPFFTWVSGWIATGHPGTFPTLNTDVLLTTLVAMLGFGGLRSFDKLKGTSK